MEETVYDNETARCIDVPKTSDKLPQLNLNYDNILPANLKEPTSINIARFQMLEHYCAMDHIPFKQMQELSKQGVLPKIYFQISPLVCPECLYGNATKEH